METHKDVVCPFCGCLCDDIELEVEDDKVRTIKNGCAISRSKFLNNHLNRIIEPTVNGEKVTYDKAIEAASKILVEAKRPVIYGLSKTDNEAIRNAVFLTELMGGVIDNTTSVCHGSSIIALQQVGCPTMTLGEAKNRADLIIFWGSNPLEAHPRHQSRYSTHSKGMYITGGRKDRYVIVLDVRATRTSKSADQFIRINPNGDYEVIQTLRALLRGEKINISEIQGVNLNDLVNLVEKMKRAKVGCIFYGLGLNQSDARHLNIEVLNSFVAELNRHTKFAVSPMRGCYNVTGANMVAAWQTGYSFAVDMSRGFPRYNPGEFTFVDLLSREEADAAIILGSDPGSSFPAEAARYLSKIPIISLERKVTPTTMISKVVIPIATSGIESEGTAYRMDAVPLKMRKVVQAPMGVFPDSKILEDITKKIEKIRGSKS